MSEIGLAVGALLLAFLLFQLRQARALKSYPLRWDGAGRVTLEEMDEVVSELTPTLRQTAMVTAPQTFPDRGHVWSSPCGKRVYIN